MDRSIDDAVKVEDSEYKDISNLRKYLSPDARTSISSMVLLFFLILFVSDLTMFHHMISSIQLCAC